MSMKQALMSKIQGALNRDNQKGNKIGDTGGFHDSGIYEKASSEDTENQTTMSASEEDDTGAPNQLEQYEQTETYFIKLNGSRTFDLKIEHFDDMIQDNANQGSWAGLDAYLIDEEFLYLEDDEADRIYKELKQRKFRSRNMEDTEQRFIKRMRDLEAMSEAQRDPSQVDAAQTDGNGLLASSDTIKQYIKNFNHNDKLDFTQGLLNFANKIEKRFLVDGLVMSLQILVKESSDIKVALLDQFIPLVQLVQEKCTQAEQVQAAKEIFRMLDELLYDSKEVVKDKAIRILLDIRHIVETDQKDNIMNLTLKLAHDEDSQNRCSALKILNEFAQDMGQTLTEAYIVPEVNSLGLDDVSSVRIAVAKNLLNISKIVSFEFFQNKIFPLYNDLTMDKEERVRKTCADQVAEIAKVSSVDKQAESLFAVYYRFLKDPTSKLVRGTAFQNIGPFIGAFKKGSQIDSKIVDFYVNTTEASQNKEVCYHASFNFPAFVYVFGSDEWPRFQSLYHKLTKINDNRIKKTLSCSIHELAKILGQKYTELDLLPCLERFLKDKNIEIKMAALKNMHVFLNVVSPEKRSSFIKYIIQTFDETGKNEWRLKQVLAQNLGNYAELFESSLVYAEFLPMFFKFCSDNVVTVSRSVCNALAPIIEKFDDDEVKQAGIVRVVKNRFFRAKTFRKRQLYIQMVSGAMMQKKELFEKYFKLDFISMVQDKCVNVRITLAKVIRHHFLKEIGGAFVYDELMNDTVRVLKLDASFDVKYQLQDIETYPLNDQREVTLDSLLKQIDELRMKQNNGNDSESSVSEDENRIESEIIRHQSEEFIDHGPVLRSLRQQREAEEQQEADAARIEKDARKKEKDQKAVKKLLDDDSDEEVPETKNEVVKEEESKPEPSEEIQSQENSEQSIN